jgi:hypothetical protein
MNGEVEVFVVKNVASGVVLEAREEEEEDRGGVGTRNGA